MNQNIFVISGLGADHTVFKRLVLPGYNLVHIQWIKPQKQDTMKSHSEKLLSQITEENPILLGLSFGGMLALEIGKMIPTKKVISLSSIIGKHELPWYYQWAGFCRLQKILPLHLFAKGNRLTQWFFGVHTKEDCLVLNEVFKNLDRDFLYWAINTIFLWKNTQIFPELYRLHGDKDLVLPFRKKEKYTLIIKGGTHLMLLDKADEVSKRLLEVLKM